MTTPNSSAVSAQEEKEISSFFLLKILAAEPTSIIATNLVLIGVLGILAVGLGAVIGFAALSILSPIGLLAFSLGACIVGALLALGASYANTKLGRPTFEKNLNNRRNDSARLFLSMENVVALETKNAELRQAILQQNSQNGEHEDSSSNLAMTGL